MAYPYVATPQHRPAVYYIPVKCCPCGTRATKTITDIIATLRTEGHQGPVEQDFIGNRLHGTDVSEFIHTHYDSLVKFLQDGS